VRFWANVEQFEREMAQEYLKGEKAVTRTMRGASDALKTRWRGQVTGAGLGRKLGNSIRGQHYPKGTESMNAAALVWTKAPKIIAAHDAGPLIRAKGGRWLAIPTEAAGSGRGGARIDPRDWERRRGIGLRFVPLRRGTAMLVADDARLNARGLAMAKRGKRRRDGILSGAQTVPVFILLRQVKLPRRLNLDRDAVAVANAIPGNIRVNWAD